MIPGLGTNTCAYGEGWEHVPGVAPPAGLETQVGELIL